MSLKHDEKQVEYLTRLCARLSHEAAQQRRSKRYWKTRYEQLEETLQSVAKTGENEYTSR